MSPLVAVRYHPVRTAFYARLGPAGNAKKVALTACMRKLVTMLKAMAKPQKPWHVQEVPRA
jgi:transposase